MVAWRAIDRLWDSLTGFVLVALGEFFFPLQFDIEAATVVVL